MGVFLHLPYVQLSGSSALVHLPQSVFSA